MIISPRKELLIINLFLIVIYFTVFSGLNIGISESILFSTNDSLSYLDVANFSPGSGSIDSLAIRPFFFPLIILLTFKTCGTYGLWLFQFLCWLGTINFLFLAVKKISNSILAYIAVALIACNLTFIVLTLHALTEASTLLLLSFLLFFITKSFHRRSELGFIHRVLLIFVFLTVIKPLFYPLVLIILLVVLTLFYFSQYRQATKKLITLLLILSPLLIQQSFMKSRYGVFRVSMISDITLRDYLFADGFALINKIDRDSALVVVKQFEPAQVKSYIWKHKKVFADVYLTNLKNNCNGYPLYLDYPARTGNPYYIDIMTGINLRCYQAHFIFFPLILIVLLLLILQKRVAEFFLLCVPVFLLYYILFTSGISGYQGDRLTLPSLPLWIFSYLATLYYFYSFISKWIKRRSLLHS